MNVRIICKSLAASVMLCTLSLACTASFEKRTAQTAPAKNSEQNVIYDDIIEASSEYMMIPVGVGAEQGLLNRDYSSEYGSKSQSYAINIIFHSLKTGQSHLLLNKKAVITQWEFLELKKEKDKPARKVLFLRLIETDTNGDQKLDGNDASVGYLADISGKNLQRLTPSNAQLISWKYDKNRGLIFLRIIKDSDKDKKFTKGDDVNFIKVNINNPKVGNEIISDKIQQQLKSLIK